MAVVVLVSSFDVILLLEAVSLLSCLASHWCLPLTPPRCCCSKPVTTTRDWDIDLSPGYYDVKDPVLLMYSILSLERRQIARRIMGVNARKEPSTATTRLNFRCINVRPETKTEWTPSYTNFEDDTTNDIGVPDRQTYRQTRSPFISSKPRSSCKVSISTNLLYICKIRGYTYTLISSP